MYGYSSGQALEVPIHFSSKKLKIHPSIENTFFSSKIHPSYKILRFNTYSTLPLKSARGCVFSILAEKKIFWPRDVFSVILGRAKILFFSQNTHPRATLRESSYVLIPRKRRQPKFYDSTKVTVEDCSWIFVIFLYL